ncbi:ribonuclease M5 [uncultured Helcococcus sp.]|uniref:ribonuclease M5 n=1 Tax=uncultured Helcococcus sp. TaxID=1072508 RepID=UPI00288B1DDE|nr:ribonuclease M5 [uncultured Helcococcus sp.]
MEDNLSIKEVIVVEGKSDIIAVRRAFDNNIKVIASHGLGLTHEFLEELVKLNERKGIIVLTDPDYAGKRIANIIREYVPNAKFASIAKKDASKNSNVGVENASDEAIIEAIKRARPELESVSDEFTMEDLVDNKLIGVDGSKEKRIELCKKLSINYTNGKQLLVKLNSFGISRDEFNKALEEIGG